MQDAFAARADLASLKSSVAAADLTARAAHAERLPALALQSSYGGAGTNSANYNQVYEVTGSVIIPPI